jgi:hypothetical protein
MLSLPLASSANPPEPTYGTATVDGNPDEWNLNNDFFTNMYRAGDSTKPLESKAYLRYDCSTQTLYILVLTEPNVPAIVSAEDAWAAINIIQNKTYNGNDNGGALPNFAWVSSNGTHALGYEAAFNLAQGSFTIIIHIQVYDDDESQTSATDGFPQNGVPLVINCPTANPAIQVNKLISNDNSTWNEADTPPGITVTTGTNVYYKFIVTNIGNVPLANIALTDDTYTLTDLNLPDTLAPDASYTYYLGPIQAQVGQHTNTATATGDYDGATVDDTNPANYYGTQADSGDICIKKYISTNRCTWYDANCPPGPTILAGKCIYYKIVIRNTGNVALSDITLEDSKLDIVNVVLPSTLQPGESFTVILGPVKAGLLQQTNNATATGTYQNTVYADSDTANYYGTLRTYTTCDYRGTGTASRLLSCNFKTVFSNGLEIGCYTNTDGYGYKWTSVTALKSFFRYTATSGPINCDALNPYSLRYGGGTLAVQTAVLSLNIAFQGSSRSMPEGLGGGILYIKDGDSLSGKTVPQILAVANDVLGGHELPEGYTYSSLKNLVENINNAFTDATPNSWAKTYLEINIAG